MQDRVAESLERLSSNPADAESFEVVERFYAREQNHEALLALFDDHAAALSESVRNYWKRLVQHLEAIAGRLGDSPIAAELYTRVGRTYEQRLDRADLAIPAYQRAFRLHPQHTEALDAARRLYARGGNWDMVLRLWELQAKVEQEPERLAGIEASMARILLDEVDDLDRAVDLARAALGRAPGHKEAARVLQDAADRTRDWEGEVRDLAARVDEADGAARIAPLLELVRFVAENVPIGRGNPDEAFRRLERDGATEPALLGLYVHWLDRQDRAAEAAEILARQTAVEPVATRAEPLQDLLRRARQLGRDDLTAAALEGIVALDPDDVTSMRELDGLLAASEQWERLAAAWEGALANGRSAVQDTTLVRRAAELLWKRLDDLDRAERWYTVLRGRDADDVPAARYFVELHAARGEAAPLVDALMTLAQLVEGPERLELWRRAAGVAEAEAGDLEVATVAWQLVLRHDEAPADARSALVRLYREQRQLPELAEQLAAELERGEGDLVGPEAALAFELAELYTGALDRLDDAVPLLERALALEPDDVACADALRRTLRQLERWTALLAVNEAQLDHVRDEPRRMELLIDVVDVATRATRAGSLRTALEALVELQPGHVPWLDQLAAAYTEDGELERAAELALRAARATGDSGERGERLIRVAELVERQLGRPDEAVERYREALESGATGVVVELERLYRSLDRPGDLAASLEQRRAALSGAERMELASLYADRLDAEVDAMALWADVILDPEHTGAAQARLLPALARVADWRGIVDVASVTGSWEAAWTTLGVAAQEAGDDVDLHDARVACAVAIGDAARELEARLAVVDAGGPTVERCRAVVAAAQEAGATAVRNEQLLVLAEQLPEDDRFPLYLQAARSWEQELEAWEAAWHAYGLAWQLDPENVRIREQAFAMAQRAATLDRHVDLVETVATLADAGPAHPIRRERARTLALLPERRADALAAWQRLLDALPGDREGLAGVRQALRGMGDPDALLAHIERELEAASDDTERVTLLTEQGELLLEDLDRPADALAPWARALALAPANIPLRDRMEATLASLERWDELVELLGSRLAFSEDEQAAATTLCRRGEVRRTRLADVDGAVADYGNVLSSFATTDAGAELLAQLTELSGEDRVWFELVVGHADRIADPSVTLPAVNRRIEVAPDEAPGLLRALISRAAATAGHERLAFETQLRLLCEAETGQDDWQLMLEVANGAGLDEELGRAWRRCFDEDGRPWLTASGPLLAGLHEHALERPEEAVAVWDRYVARNDGPTEGSDQALERLLRQTADTARLAKHLNARAVRGDAALAVERWLEAASLFEAVDDIDRAMACYDAVVGQQEDHDEAWQSGAALLEDRRQFKALVSWLDRRLALPANAEARADIETMRANALFQLGDRDGAIEALLAALRSLPGHRTALQELEVMAAPESGASPDARRDANEQLAAAWGALGQPTEESLALERLAELAETFAERAGLLLRASRICDQQLGDHARAFQCAHQALRATPEDDAVREQLESLAESLGAWDEVASAYEDVLPQLGDAERGALHLQLAGVLMRQVDDPDRAAQHLERALRILGDDEANLVTLESIYRRAERTDQVIEVLDRRSAVLRDAGRTEEAIELATDAARLAEEDRGDLEQASRRWRAITEDPGHAARAWSELARIELQRGDVRRVLEALTNQVALASDDVQRAELHTERALLLEDQLRDREQAAAAWESVLLANPESHRALQELDRLYRELEAHDARATVLRRIVALQPDAHASRAELGALLAVTLAATAAGDESAAQEASPDDGVPAARDERVAEGLSLVVEALRADRTMDRAVETLVDLSRRADGSGVDAIEALIEHHDATSNLVQLVKLLEQRASREPDAEARIPWLRRTMALYAGPLQEPAEALRVGIELWVSHGGDAAGFEELYELAADCDGWADLARAGEVVASASGPLWLHRRLGYLYTDELPQPERRLSHLREAFLQLPSDRELFEALLGALDASPSDEEERELLELRLTSDIRDAERAPLLKRLGLLLMRIGGHDERAAEALRQYRNVRPGDEEIRPALRQALHAIEAWDELDLLIDDELWVSNDAGRRVELLAERVELARRREASVDALVGLWGEMLTADPRAALGRDNLLAVAKDPDVDDLTAERAIELLDLAYRQSSDWAQLVDLLYLKKDRAPEWERADLLRDVVEIASHELRDDAVALRAAGYRLALLPSDAAALTQVEQLADRCGRWDIVVEALDEAAAAADDDAVRRRLERRRAIFAGRYLGELDQALGLLTELYTETGDQTLVDDVEALLGDSMQRDRRAQWLMDQCGRQGQEELCVDLLRRAAIAWLSPPARVAEGGEVLERLHAMQPGNALADEIDGIYAENGFGERRIAWLRRLIADLAPDDRDRGVTLTRRLAEALAAAGPPDGDAVAAFERWHELAPEAAELRRALRDLVTATANTPTVEGGVRDRVFELASRVARDAGDHELLDEVEDHRIALATDPGSLERAWVAAVQRRLDEEAFARAFDTARRALTSLPGSAALAERFEKAAAAVSRWEEAAALYRHLANQRHDERLPLLFQAARVDVEHLGLDDRAVQTLRQVLDIDPAHEGARQVLMDLVENAQRGHIVEPAARVLIDSATGVDQANAARFAVVRRAIAEGRKHVAIFWSDEILEADPDHIPARTALLELSNDPTYAVACGEVLLPVLRTEGAWAELAAVLERMYVQVEEDDRRVELVTELADLKESRLNASDDAFRLYRLALIWHPEGTGAAAAMVRNIRGPEQVAEAVETLREQIPRTTGAGQRADLLTALGRLEIEHGAAPVEGEQHLLEALAAAPAHAEALDGLEAHYLDARNHRGLVHVLGMRARAVAGQPEERTFVTRIVNLLRSNLEAPGEAIAAWRDYLTRNASDVEALEELEALLREVGQHADVVATMQQRARLNDDHDERNAILISAAEYGIRRGVDYDRIKALLEGLLREDAELVVAAELLADLHRTHGRHAELVRTLQRIAQLATHEDDVIAAQREITEAVRAGGLDTAIALKALQRVREIRVDVDWANEQLEQLLADAGRDRELAALQEELVTLVPSEASAAVRSRLARTLMRLQRFSDAAHEVDIIGRVAAGAPETLELASTVYQRVGRWDEAAGALEARLTNGNLTDEDRAPLLFELARIEEQHQKRGERAIALYEQAFRLGLRDESLYEALERAYEQAGSWEQLMTVLEQHAAGSEGASAARLWMRIALIARDRLRDEEREFRALRGAIEVDGSSLDAAEQLVAIAIRRGDLDYANAIVNHAAARPDAASRQRQYRTLYMQGRLALAQGNQPAALALFEQSRALVANHAPNLLALAECLVAAQRWNEALEILQATLVNQAKLQNEGRVRTLVLMGRTRLALGDPERARDMLTRAWRLDPDNSEAEALLQHLDGNS